MGRKSWAEPDVATETLRQPVAGVEQRAAARDTAPAVVRIITLPCCSKCSRPTGAWVAVYQMPRPSLCYEA